VYPDVPALYGHIIKIKIIRANNGRLNFHDALISLFMREHDLTHIVSFDKDFDQVEKIMRIGNDEQIK